MGLGKFFHHYLYRFLSREVKFYTLGLFGWVIEISKYDSNFGNGWFWNLSLTNLIFTNFHSTFGSTWVSKHIILHRGCVACSLSITLYLLIMFCEH